MPIQEPVEKHQKEEEKKEKEYEQLEFELEDDFNSTEDQVSPI